jgi:LPS export ABC transporter protein LptC
MKPGKESPPRRSGAGRRHDISNIYDYETAPMTGKPGGLFARRRPWVLLFIAVGLLWIARLGVGPSEGPPAWEGLPQGEEIPDAMLEGFQLVSTDQGVKQWELFAQSAKMFQKSREAYTEQIYIEYYRNNRIISTLTADRGIINTFTNDTRAEGNVELIAENGAKLQADKLHWNAKTRMISSEGRVRITKGLDDITAVGMEADARLDNVRFKSDVHTRVRDAAEIQNFERRKRF